MKDIFNGSQANPFLTDEAGQMEIESDWSNKTCVEFLVEESLKADNTSFLFHHEVRCQKCNKAYMTTMGIISKVNFQCSCGNQNENVLVELTHRKYETLKHILS